MILTKLVLSTIKEELDTLEYTNFLYIAPQTTSYPFVVFFPFSDTIEYTFGEVIEDVNIQMSIYADNAATLLDMAQGIEESFDELSVSAESDGYKIMCTHRTNEVGPEYIQTENYWQYTMELQFKSWREKITE